MSFKALVYAYVLGGITFVPLVILALIAYTIYTSVPVGDPDLSKPAREARAHAAASDTRDATTEPLLDLTDVPKARKGWLTMRRTFEESSFEGSYVTLVKSFLDARSKDPKRSRPRDMWYVVLKGKVLYLYEDESMTECEAAIELGSHDVVIFPEGLLDGELFAKRNAICLKPKLAPSDKGLPSLTRDMHLDPLNVEQKLEEKVGAGSSKKKHKEREREKERLLELERKREEALDLSTPWFIFVRSNVEMEDWYFALIHASDNAANTPTLAPLQAIFSTADMNYLVTTLDEQPDVIPMRWLNALLGRLFFSYYRTDALESYIIGRLMKKLSKVKRPNFLTDVVVTEVYVGNKSATFSKPMLKELTKEGDAALEVRMSYKGEIRVTVQATATINLGSRFKPYTVKLTLAAVLRELEGNLVVKVKRPPSNRIWYAFTQAPRMVFDVEPVVSDRQITWSMILNSIESRLKEVIMESIVMPNMDDIAFFDTSRCVHRGGIWPDAGRREKPAEAEAEPSPPSSEEDLSPVSGPAQDVVASSPSLEGEPADIKRSQSEPEVRGDKDPSVSGPLSRAATTAIDTQSTSSSTRSAPKRRPTWFPSNHHSGKHHPTHMVDDPEPLPGAESEADLPKSDSTLLDVSHDAGESPRQIRRKGSKFLTIRKSSRSPSPGPPPLPPSRSPSPVPSLDMNRPDSPDSLGRPASVKSSKSSKSSKSTRSKEHPPASPSLFSSLKSRAGDRQALGTSAKETMRKWGVNWAGLKKDNGAASAGSAAEDVPDGGDRRSSDSSFTAHKAKASYAEVRAAVAERKERERSAQVAGGGVHANGGASDPIPIPVPARDVRVWSGTSSQGDSSIMSAGGGSVSSTSSRGRSYSGDRTLEPPPMVRTRTPSTERPADELAPAEASGASPYADLGLVQGRPPAPIHTQPSQGKTMTIPGIHASHRGEVMAMGYVPPTPPPPPPPENKGKASGIQSVYRLWKSPTLPPQDANGGAPESRPERPSSPPPPAPPPLEQEAEVSPVSPVVPTMSRPPPPPLPPRSASSKAIEAIAARRMSLMHTDDTPPADPLARVLENDRVRPDSPTLPPPTPPGASSESSHPDASPVHAPVPSTPAAPDITFTVPTPVRGEIAKPPLPPRNAPATAAV